MSQQGDPSTYWHLDKRVPIVLIATLIAQFALGIFFFGHLYAKVEFNTNAIGGLQKNYTTVPLQLVRLETLMESINNQLTKLSTGVESHERRYHDERPNP